MIKQIALHHTAVSSPKPQIHAVNKYHKNKNWGTTKNPFYLKEPSSLGWYVAYNYLVDIKGKVWHTRQEGVDETYANKGHNCDVEERCDTISICLSGNFNIEFPNHTQIDSLKSLIKKLRKDYTLKLKFHSDIQKNRTCPGKFMTTDYAEEMIWADTIPVKNDKEDKSKEKGIDCILNETLLTKILNILIWIKNYLSTTK